MSCLAGLYLLSVMVVNSTGTHVFSLKVIDLWILYDPVEVPHYSIKYFEDVYVHILCSNTIEDSIKNVEMV